MAPLRSLKSLSLSFFVCCLAFLSGCGPKVTLGKESALILRNITVLPAKYEANVARETVDYVNEAFVRSLVARGFGVISDQALVNACRNADCKNLANLANATNADALAEIVVSSTASANLIAGYSKSITGNAKLFSSSGSEITRIEHTEYKRGGLLFNSGQVLEGIESTVDSFDSESKNLLADKFVETIVNKFPIPVGTSEATTLNSDQIVFASLGSGRYLICVESSNAISASLKVAQQTIPLRSNEKGKFCGAFLLDLLETNVAPKIVLNGRYGQSKNVPIDTNKLQFCKTDQVIMKAEKGLSFSGEEMGCREVNFLVFAAPTAAGPFVLKGKLNNSASALTLGSTSEVVAVVGVSEKLGNSKTLFFK